MKEMKNSLVLNTIALEPNRWTADKIARFELEELIPAIARSGFKNVEIWGYHLMRRTGDEIKGIGQLLKDNSIAAPIVGLYPIMHLEGAAAEAELDDFKRVCEYATTLGTTMIKIWVGRLGSDAIDAAALKRTHTFYEQAWLHASGLGLQMSAENHANTLLDTLEGCQSFLDTYAESGLKICFQPYDFTDTTLTCHEFETLMPHVAHIHLQGRRNDAFVLLENAEIDYHAFLKTALNAHHPLFFSIEFVEGCVVAKPADFDMDAVLKAAREDRIYVLKTGNAIGLSIDG